MEKFSSMHDDFRVPFQDKDIPEYDPEKGYPHRHEDIGESGEKSVLWRMSQLGVSEEDLGNLGVKNVSDITEDVYSKLVRESVEKQYNTIFASIFDHWSNMPDSKDQFEVIRDVSKFYKKWGFNLVPGQESDKPSMVISLEGADLVENIDDIRKINKLGVRSIGLQYGKENNLANERGLTKLGAESVKEMMRL
jgi:microsomal dipeptidase-like Zn-dependent dipeptidase